MNEVLVNLTNNTTVPISGTNFTFGRPTELTTLTVTHHAIELPEVFCVIAMYAFLWWYYVKVLSDTVKYTDRQRKIFYWLILLYPVFVVIAFIIQIIQFKAFYGL